MKSRTTRCGAVLAAGLFALGLLGSSAAASTDGPDHSVARQWNDLLLDAIRRDFARPTIHARNLYHTSVAMWDAWAAYDCFARQVLVSERAPDVSDIEAARRESISFAAFRILNARFAKSPGAPEMLPLFRAKMVELGYDPDYSATVGATPAALGNRIAVTILYYGLHDGANEAGGYINLYYEPLNPPLVPALPGNPDIIDLNRWQPIALDFFVDQSGHVVIGGYPEALSPEWGHVLAFALDPADQVTYTRDGFDYVVSHDPGGPPTWTSDRGDEYKAGFETVAINSAALDPSDGVLIDISPASMGDNPLGTNDGDGYKVNPVTGEPYTPHVVPAGDFYRILAEFWADGPDSETPPGHWFTLLNDVADHPLSHRRFNGGPELDPLEWDVKSYLALGGAMHDAAVTAWGIKGWYDYIRPISAIRALADLGQCTDPGADSYDPGGINLHPGFIELVTLETTLPGARHEHLVGEEGKIAIYGWRGPAYIDDPETDVAGVGWILAENWWPYQRPTFVTPPFPGYVSGHSTYSRAAAEVLSMITGSIYFPGGLAEYLAPAGEYLVFEDGPSVDVTLQWASYYDAADQSGISRIYGGIHPPADDIPGRFIGVDVGLDAFEHALTFFDGNLICICPEDLDGDARIAVSDIIQLLTAWGPCKGCPADLDGSGVVDVTDLLQLLAAWGACY